MAATIAASKRNNCHPQASQAHVRRERVCTSLLSDTARRLLVSRCCSPAASRLSESVPVPEEALSTEEDNEVSVPEKADMANMASAGHGDFFNAYTVYWHMVYWPSVDKLDIVRMRVTKEQIPCLNFAVYTTYMLLGLDGLLVLWWSTLLASL